MPNGWRWAIGARHATQRETLKENANDRYISQLRPLHVYSYDAAGQLLSEDGPWDDDTVSYTYQNRLRTGLSLPAPNASAWVQSYGYDVARRLTNVTSAAGSFTYTLGGTVPTSPLIKKLLLPGGALITNRCDGNARMLGTYLLNSGSTILDSADYIYNVGNQRTQEVFTAGNYMNFTYDNIGQLKTALGSEPSGTTNRMQEQLGYFYDAAGNLNYRTNNTLLQQFNVNNLNELTTVTNGGKLTVAGTTTSPATNVTVNGLNANLYVDSTFASTNQPWVNGNNSYTAIAKDHYGRMDTNSITVDIEGTNAFVYDLNGNLRTNGTRVFEYDDENQLVRITEPNAWKSEFAYDGKMRRRIRKEYTWSGGTWLQTNEVRYVYDGNLVIQERDLNNLPQVTYTRGTDLSGSLQGAGGIGGLLARTANPLTLNPQTSIFATALYHADGNGNITCLIYTNQIIAAKYEYDPYGHIMSQSGSLAGDNLYRFSSKEYNSPSGLVYYLYRYYEPNLQRWPNRDPLGEPGFEALRRRQADLLGDGPNLYTFLKGNPVNRTDSLGLDGEATLELDPTLLMDDEELAAYRAKQCKCAILAAAVQAAKKGVGALGGPKSGDSCAVLKAKTAAWLVLAVARSRLNNVCFGGGNPTHQEETAKAWAQVSKGIALQTEKGCVGSPTGKFPLR